MPEAVEIPKRALVVLCGPSAVGKSTWARHHFVSSQIIASDRCRHMVSDDLNWHEPEVSDSAFDLLYHWVEQRLRLNRLAVVDSTALMTGTRRRLLRTARRWNSPAVLVTFDVDFETCLRRDEERPDSVGRRVMRRQFKQLRHERSFFHREGWDHILTLDVESEENCPVRLRPLPHERPDDAGPFDIIGDVHGCLEELEALLARLGWQLDADGLPVHPEGRRLIFVGDLACGGPHSVPAWDLALRLRRAGRASILAGDHDLRFARLLRGECVALDRGLEVAAAEMARQSPESLEDLRRRLQRFLADAPPHLLLDEGRLAVAHAALADHMLGKDTRRVRQFCRHGEGPNGNGRGGWVHEHHGTTLVVHGHTPTAEPRMVNHTLNVDTGCVLGGRLTAFRWPERRVVQVPALRTHWGDGFDVAPIAGPELNVESVAG